ncbi:MAG TPA: hydrogenase maturation nickel metallochaperone HypA [Lacipirellulaceae bacterium]|jgi:hydrogenase nickel incorporation protein HypA/HybF|nr:hydrogenase maturation nickel metallochaperone HypA [Lacipirellulaceae bacterium]
MHELSIAMSVLDIAADEAERRNGANITAIHIKLGPLSGVIPQALVSAFDLARETTPQAGCILVIEEVPIIAYCEHCQASRSIESPQWLCCPECGAPTAKIEQGRELEVTALEIEA